ncbi:MAG: NAD(+)/NADH kinase [Myxococcota bacterium]|nr:NAD(+)/NADH kinase [Deltaproteobacteria bacterium]MDQ3339928.1 NAD(+)/NADH kinase [Myxococcota bacterium]
MRVAILLNSKAGKLDRAVCEERAQQIQDAFTKHSVESEVFLCEPARLTRTAQQLASKRFDAVVAGGGDGTVSAVAGGLAGTEMPLAVIPLGTLNHFAKDLAMPQELDDAVRAIAEGENQPIDVGELNGRVFINNSSIGLYPQAVVVRDDQRKRRGWGKFPAMLLACARVLWRFPLLGVVVQTPESTVVTKTPFVFFGNNEYTTSLFSLGKREALDKGTLCIHTVRAKSRAKMFWLMVRALLGTPEEVRNFEAQSVTEATVRCTKRHLHVALDGEVLRMTSPLSYRIRPGALIVRRPRREPVAVAADEPIAAGGAR